jgi:glycosyltransferase involved in cell wall biosynthesis
MMSQKTNRVALVLSSKEKMGDPAGGIHKAVLAQIAALHAHGIRVHLLTASEPCAQSAQMMGATVDYSPVWHNAIKPILFPKYWLKLIRLRFSGIRAVIHHNGRTWAWGYLFFPGIPQIQVLHREEIGHYRYFRRWLALSSGYAAYLKKHHGMLGWRKIAWAPHCTIETSIPKPSPAPRRANRPFTLGFVGRNCKAKGTDLLIEAAAKIISDGNDLKIHFAGSEKAYVMALAKRYNVTTHVEFTEWLADLGPYLDSIDLLVVPSEKEAFGLVLLDAMSRGKPILATACNGPADIIVEGETGWLVPIEDAEALANGIRNAMNDPSLSAVGMKGYERLLEQYIPSTMGERLKQALESLGARWYRETHQASKITSRPDRNFEDRQNHHAE